jgi:hypothetical protein
LTARFIPTVKGYVNADTVRLIEHREVAVNADTTCWVYVLITHYGESFDAVGGFHPRDLDPVVVLPAAPGQAVISFYPVDHTRSDLEELPRLLAGWRLLADGSLLPLLAGNADDDDPIFTVCLIGAPGWWVDVASGQRYASLDEARAAAKLELELSAT